MGHALRRLHSQRSNGIGRGELKMKLPVLHNFKAIQGEVISLNIGYNTVSSDNLFACVRKLAHDEEYKAKFNRCIRGRFRSQ